MRERLTATPRRARPRLVDAYREQLDALAAAKLACATLVGLALLRQILRIVPTLAIGLVIDKVATNRATATLTVIIAGLGLIAIFELVFANAHGRLRRALGDQIERAAIAAEPRAAARRSLAAIDLVETSCVAPLATTIMIAALTTASPRVGLLVLAFTLAQLVAAFFGGRARDRLAARLRAVERDLETGSPASRAVHAAAVEAAELQRARAGHSLAMLSRLAYAATLGLGSLDMIDAVMTPGGLIAAMMILRQLQQVAETGVQIWLRAVELAPREIPSIAPALPLRAA